MFSIFMIFTFQVALLALILFSFLMVVTVPVIFASSNAWNENKNLVLLGAITWAVLVFIVGTLNYFLI